MRTLEIPKNEVEWIAEDMFLSAYYENFKDGFTFEINNGTLTCIYEERQKGMVIGYDF